MLHQIDRRRRVALGVLGLAASLSGAPLMAVAEPVAATVPSASVAGDPGWQTILQNLLPLQPTPQEPTPQSEASTETVSLDPPPGPGAFSMNLYRKGDFVHQQTTYWCVAASVQTMMNIIDEGKPNRSAAFQKRLHFEGRQLEPDEDGHWQKLAGPERWRKGLHGLGLTEWTGMLNSNGYGPYKLDRAKSRNGAIKMAAKAIRMTGQPAGLVVWRGAHAWVMSGFTATADPAYSDDFEITSVFIQDPWFPYVSSIWGASRPPNAKMSMRALGVDFLPYKRPGRRQPMRDGKFMLVLPTEQLVRA